MMTYMSSDDEQVRAGLESLREDIDVIDLKIVEELAESVRERRKIAEKIGAYKKQHEIPVRDQGREGKVISDRRERGRSKGLPGDMIERLFKDIIADAREHE